MSNCKGRVTPQRFDALVAQSRESGAKAMSAGEDLRAAGCGRALDGRR